MLVARVTNLVKCIKDLKEQGLWVVGADMGGSEYFLSNIPPHRTGHWRRGQGIRKLVRQNCDMLVSIPMSGKVASLNASVAAGIIIYEVIRQRCCPDMP